MNTALRLPWPGLTKGENAATNFHSLFEHAPMPVARCTAQGVIAEMNPAFASVLSGSRNYAQCLRLSELARPENRERTEMELRELLECRRNSVVIESSGAGTGQGKPTWRLWRQTGEDRDHVLLTADELPKPEQDEKNLLQTQRWEAVGRLTGGVVHDFNNLLTGVMLCSDEGDRRRRYAEEIRAAILQSSSLVQQLLVFARPPATSLPHPRSFNDIATAMRELLTRLIGEHIALDLCLDPELGLVEIDQAQAQQVLLNLILNARDALPEGGRITVETSNCNFQPLASSLPQRRQSGFPCVLLAVSDNGRGMSEETRKRLFEPFFTTKNEGKGTGLGLTTVRSIVTTHGGLIHFDSEAGRGTRAMILLPRTAPARQFSRENPATPEFFVPDYVQQAKKESLL